MDDAPATQSSKPSSKSSSKPRRGRPPRIDREAALAAAMGVFWEMGFDGASLDDLTNAMGLSRPALYAAFGDKKSLFERALRLYAETDGAAGLRALDAAPGIEAAVTGFLRAAVESATQDARPSGCFLACAATQGQTAPLARETVLAGATCAKARLLARFEAALREGALTARPSPEERADLTLDIMNALSLRARMGEPREALLAALSDRVSAVLRAG